MRTVTPRSILASAAAVGGLLLASVSPETSGP